VSNAKQRLDGDLQLIIPTIPAESMDKTEVDYELILQVLSMGSFCLFSSPSILHSFF
jgi:hypothetical protein